jgi:hypothetical protein
MIDRESLARVTRPRVAAVAPSSANAPTGKVGIANPTNESVIQVGGANAGITLRVKTRMKSITARGI